MSQEVDISIIERKIYVIRGERVMVDEDLASLYEVTTKRFNEQVKRNSDRFPTDFMFQLREDEYEFLRSQIATLKKGRGVHRKYLPYVFTEQGVAMLSGVLNSKRAVEVNVAIMRTFVKMRRMLADNALLREKVNQMEKSYDKKFQHVFMSLRQLFAR